MNWRIVRKTLIFALTGGLLAASVVPLPIASAEEHPSRAVLSAPPVPGLSASLLPELTGEGKNQPAETNDFIGRESPYLHPSIVSEKAEFARESLHPIDTTLRPDAHSPDFSYRMLNNAFQVYINHRKDEAAFSFAAGDHAVIYRPLQMNPVDGTVRGNEVSFSEAWTHTDLRYVVETQQLKMELLLKNRQAPKHFRFRLQTNGVTPQMNDDGSIDFVDREGNRRFQSPPMWVQDSSSTAYRYDRLQVDIQPAGQEWIVHIALRDEGLTYPLVIDPSTALISDWSSGGYQYSYDDSNRLHSIVSPGQTVNFHYDADGNLTQRQVITKILENGGFESYTGTDGLADGWIRTTAGSAPNVVRSTAAASAGNASHYIADSGIANGQFSGIYQYMWVDPGKAFRISGQLRTASLSNAKALLHIDFFDAQRQFAGGHTEELAYPTQDWFVTVSGTGTTPANAAFAIVSVLLQATANGGAGQLYADLVQFQYDVPENLLTNAGFEQSTSPNGVADGWIRYWSGNIRDHQTVTSPASAGGRSHRIADSGLSSGWHSGIHQYVQAEPNRAFRVGGQLRIDSLTSAKVELRVEFWNAQRQSLGGSQRLEDVGFTTGGKFITINGAGTTPANAAFASVYLVLLSLGGGSGQAYVDQMEFWYSTDGNLLANAGYELTTAEGIADGWNVVTAGSAPNVARSTNAAAGGAASHRIADTGLANGQASGITQHVQVKPGLAFLASGQLRIDNLTGAKVQLQIDFWNAQHQNVGSQTEERNTLTQSQFVTMTRTGTTPANAAYATVSVWLRATANGGSGQLYVDQIRLQL